MDARPLEPDATVSLTRSDLVASVHAAHASLSVLGLLRSGGLAGSGPVMVFAARLNSLRPSAVDPLAYAPSIKRVGAPVAVTCYLDRSPAPPPKEHIAAGTRDRGAGRSTKRDRRLIERLRGH